MSRPEMGSRGRLAGPALLSWAALLVVAWGLYESPLLTLAGVLGVATLAIAYSSPRFALVLWLAVVAFVPFWSGVSSPLFLPPATLISLLLLPRLCVGAPARFGRADGLVAMGLIALGLMGVVGLSRPGDASVALTQWLVSLVVGRQFVRQLGGRYVFRCIALVFGLVAALAIIEFVSGWNPYYSWPGDNAQHAIWAFDQIRAGRVRSEWAFGHAIALSLCLAMAIPVALAAQLRPVVQLSIMALLVGGVVVAFSRAGFGVVVLGLLMSVVLLGRWVRTSTRLAVIVSGAVGALLLIPFIEGVFAEAGTEAAGSAEYRFRLLGLASHMNPIGLADGISEPSPGVVYFGGYASIDNAYLHLGLNFGYLALGAALVGAVAALVMCLRSRSAVAVSVAAALPALFTVAMITQFGGMFWFYVGAMIALASGSSPETASRRHSHTAAQSDKVSASARPG